MILQAQSDLIIPDTLPLSSLPSVTQEIVGFFIIETHVLDTTGNFRSERDVEELWDALVGRLCTTVERVLQNETDADSFLRVKESLIAFVMTLEVLVTIPVIVRVMTICVTDQLLFDYEPAHVHPRPV